eukprot:4042332-Prymnesium_polylepis.1
MHPCIIDRFNPIWVGKHELNNDMAGYSTTYEHLQDLLAFGTLRAHTERCACGSIEHALVPGCGSQQQ